MISRAVFLLAAVASLMLRGPIHHKLDLARHGPLSVAFHSVLALWILTLLFGCVRGRSPPATFLLELRRRPLLGLLLFFNGFLGTLLLVKLLTGWGVVIYLLVASLLLGWWLLLPEESRGPGIAKLLRLSPLSFLALYLFLGLGELLLRRYPAFCGSGGGGNPALGQLYAGLYSYNSDGIRDDEIDELRTANSRRILALGDSFTFGQGVRFEECYPQQLERELSSGEPSREIQVINAGKPAANTEWEVAYLERRGERYDPDLVLVQFYSNDIEVREYADDPGTPGTDHPAMRRINRFFARSYILFFLRDHCDRLVMKIGRWADAEIPQDYLAALAERVRQDDPGWRRCLQAFDRLAGWSKEQAVPLAVVLFPHPGEAHPGVTYLHQRLAEQLERKGIACLDLREMVNRIPPGVQLAHPFDHHPSPTYYKAAARRIARFLREERLLGE